jgi:hypothetical protein
VKKKTMKAVVENPELFQVSINGRLLKPLKNRWWLDKAFGVFDIGENVQSGENVVTVKSSPFTIFTELEPIYILGDFAVEGASKGFRIVDSRPLNFGSWVDQGMPFYAHGVKYAKQCQISTAELKSKRFAVQLGRWSGTIAKVNVNGKSVGEIAFAPFELDVTRFLKSGKNDIVVTVYGSLKNTLGPHHNNPQLGRAWPGSFQQGEKDGYPPGSKYSLVGYGLLDDFVVKSGTAK